MTRKLRIVADSSALLRHVTSVSVPELVRDLRAELAVPLADAERRGVQASNVDAIGWWATALGRTSRCAARLSGS